MVKFTPSQTVLAVSLTMLMIVGLVGTWLYANNLTTHFCQILLTVSCILLWIFVELLIVLMAIIRELQIGNQYRLYLDDEEVVPPSSVLW